MRVHVNMRLIIQTLIEFVTVIKSSPTYTLKTVGLTFYFFQGRYFRETKRNYLKASRYSTIAVGLAISTICYTLFLSFLITVLPTIFSSGKSNGYVFSCRILEHNNYGSRENYEYGMLKGKDYANSTHIIIMFC